MISTTHVDFSAHLIFPRTDTQFSEAHAHTKPSTAADHTTRGCRVCGLPVCGLSMLSEAS